MPGECKLYAHIVIVLTAFLRALIVLQTVDVSVTVRCSI